MRVLMFTGITVMSELLRRNKGIIDKYIGIE